GLPTARPQSQCGRVVRPLPVALSEALPVVPRPGETISVRVRAAEPGTIACTTEDGAALEVSVDGGAPAKSANVAAGPHTVSIRGTQPKIAIASLGLAPTRLAASTPLPVITEATLAALPKFPVLTETSPAFLDLARDEPSSFLVTAEKPALYRLETTGLLSTSGNLRSRIVTSFLKSSANGIGRNFLIQSYLRSGDYQLSVSPNAP